MRCEKQNYNYSHPLKMGMVNSALSALPEQKMFDKLRKLSSGALGTVGKAEKEGKWAFFLSPRFCVDRQINPFARSRESRTPL